MTDLAARLAGRRVVVYGDAILDRYLHGSVERISPEAPVPVVKLQQRELRAGGAANVALNLAALGTAPILVSVCGADDPGGQLAALLEARGVGITGLTIDAERPTTVKTRVLARHQQVVRIDEENDQPLRDRLAQEVTSRVLELLETASALIVSDYAKGLLDTRTLAPVLERARALGVPTIVDPKRRRFDLYAPATVLTPNQNEIARATGRDIHDEPQTLAAARQLLDELPLDAVLVTRGEAGMLLVPRRGAVQSIATEAREVFDVTGAGDTVAATLAAMLAGGLGLTEAARWANAAAAISVGRLGTAAVGLTELQRFAGTIEGSP